MAGRKLLVGVMASAALVSVVCTVGAHAGSPGPVAAIPVCNPAGPPVAHHGGQALLDPKPDDAPAVCGTLTGWPAVENRIEVTNNDTVVYEPALQAGPGGVLGGDGHVPGNGVEQSVARSTDNGGHWDAVSVQVWPDDHVLDGQVDNNLFSDHTTNRLFWYMYNPMGTPQVPYTCGGAGGTVAYSDTNGGTWNWGLDHDHACSENPTVLTAAETVPNEQVSYGTPTQRRITYLCGDNTSTGIATTGTPGFSCSKSLDGGNTWLGTTLNGQGFYSGKAKDALAPYPECAGQSSTAGADVQPLPVGTLTVVVSCNSATFLAESSDEGATWTIARRLPHGGSLRTDSGGNLYLLSAGTATNGDSQLLLTHSADGGADWSPPQDMVAPGVVSVGTSYFVQGTFDDGLVGDVAVAYYGIRKGQTTSDGFITATRDALDDNPVFWSGQVNPDSHPLLYNTPADGDIGITVLDFNGGAWNPNGSSVWGSWVQDCGSNVATDPGCTSRYPAINPGNPDNGYAGHLVWPGQEG